jgi:hypothetical protein
MGHADNSLSAMSKATDLEQDPWSPHSPWRQQDEQFRAFGLCVQNPFEEVVATRNVCFVKEGLGTKGSNLSGDLTCDPGVE